MLMTSSSLGHALVIDVTLSSDHSAHWGPCVRMTRMHDVCACSRALALVARAPLSRVSLRGWPCALCLSSWKGPELPSRPKGWDTAGRLPSGRPYHKMVGCLGPAGSSRICVAWVRLPCTLYGTTAALTAFDWNGIGRLRSEVQQRKRVHWQALDRGHCTTSSDWGCDVFLGPRACCHLRAMELHSLQLYG